MIKIEVLGAGCAKCKKTAERIKNEIKNLAVDAEVVKVEDVDEIISRGILMTPVVIVDGKKKIGGKVPSVKEIRSWFE